MRSSVAAFTVVALTVVGCSSPVQDSPADVAASPGVAAPSLPATGMDGRPAFDPVPPGGSLPPGWIRGNGGAGPSGPPAAIVPDVRGMVFERAVLRLWHFGIDFDLVVARTSDRTLWSVIEQNPLPGSDTPTSGKIDLVLALRLADGVERSQLRQCDPTAADLSDPYCLGRRLQYFE